jgi:flagellar biosynthesis/type III secretory pathway protein FliH
VILRDVIIASDRERLKGPRAVGWVGQPSPPERQPVAAVVPEVEPRVAPPLSLERVCEWLEAQSCETRMICARRLAPELEALAQAAREAGRDEGRVQGRQESLESVRSSLSALARAAAVGEQAFVHECAQLAEGCADIVAEVFRRLAGEALVSREATLGVVLEVLKRAKDERALTIRVSPHDLPFLETQRTEIQTALGTRSFAIYADPRVVSGGCLVESSLGMLDGRLETQLQELAETLRVAKASAGTSG